MRPPTARTCTSFELAVAAGRDDDHGFEPGARGIRRRRRGRVAGRRAHDGRRAALDRPRDGDAHPAVLERAGRIRAFPLEPELDAEPLRQARRPQQRRVALAERDRSQRPVRDDRGDERAAEHLGERGDLRERGGDLSERRLVQHEIERRLAVAETLHELRDRHLVRGEPARGVREHARPVGDVEVDVERRAPGVRIEPVELAPAGVVLEKAGARGADDAHEVCNDGGRRLRPARARALRA